MLHNIVSFMLNDILLIRQDKSDIDFFVLWLTATQTTKMSQFDL